MSNIHTNAPAANNIRPSRIYAVSEPPQALIRRPYQAPGLKSDIQISSEFELRKARLRADHAQEQAKMAENVAMLEAKRTVQMARQTAEMAELVALALEDVIVSEERTSSRVEEWLADQRHVRGEQGAGEELHSIKNYPVPDIPSCESGLNPNAPIFHNLEHPKVNLQHKGNTQQKPSYVEPIDAWIDKLVPGQETSLYEDSNLHLTQALVKLESERDLPKVELPIFNGNPLMWPRFVEQFYAMVHMRNGLNDTRRMDLLQSHVKGEAKILIQGLGYSGKNYALSLQELKSAFGHRVKVAKAFLDKIVNGAPIQPHNSTALRQFYLSIRDCITTLQQLNYLADITSSSVLMRTAERLPSDKITKWNEKANSILKHRDPTLIDLQLWLKDRVDADLNPYAVKSEFKKPVKPSSTTHERHKITTMNTGVFKSNTPKKIPCPLCKKDHYIYRCQLFIDMSVPERYEITKEHLLCFNCLKPNHRTDNCSSSTCRECQKKHHTLLHKTQHVAIEATSKKVETSGTSVYFQLVSVVVAGNNGRRIQTYGILDTASEITMIEESFAKDLGLKGRKHNLHLKTITNNSTRQSTKVTFKVQSAHGFDPKALTVNEAWTVQSDAFHCPSQQVQESWDHIQELNMPNIHPSQVKLLIGMNVPEAHLQTQIIQGRIHEPIAVKTGLGWCLMGMSAKTSQNNDNIQARVNLILQERDDLRDSMEKFWTTESFGTFHQHKIPTSVEDKKSMQILDNSTKFIDGKYEVPMLWKENSVSLPNNKKAADRRFELLEKKLKRHGNEEFKRLYQDTMNEYISKGYAQKIQTEPINQLPRTWYIPHHGVVNPNKPGKVRVVFDAAAKYQGTSLNDNLMTGPDLLNSLFGILLRFRLYKIAVAADVEGMFHQVRVPPKDQESLRFLWKADIDQNGPPSKYQMNVHIFGATDSPSCANYALRRTANDHASEFSPLTIQTTERDFYVDDLLTSVEHISKAQVLSKEITDLLQLGGFRLHKWTSNSKQLMNTIPEKDRAIHTSLDFDESPIQRALGLRWCVTNDTFIFDPKQYNHTVNTKRGIVSVVSSIFDPCGFLAPFTIRAKYLIQEIWRSDTDWDDSPPQEITTRWKSWYNEIEHLSTFTLHRHHLHLTSNLEWIEVHMFADASEKAFGSVAYLRYLTSTGIVCSFLASKTRVSPLKPQLSIPRLELQGAVLAVRLWNSVKDQLPLPVRKVMYWTDSNTVLQYINNQTKRFKPFVSNRIAEIQESSHAEQWRHVPTAENPADYCSRGLPASTLTPEHQWFTGPTFLWSNEDSWPGLKLSEEIPSTDKEIKGSICMLLNQNHNTPQLSKFQIDSILDPEDFSKWNKLSIKTAWILRAIRNFLSPVKRFNIKAIKEELLVPDEYHDAMLCWTSVAQRTAFSVELDCLQKGNDLPKNSCLLPLTPIFDGTHIRIGGRLRKALIPQEAKHQLILPTKGHISHLIMLDAHLNTAHSGVEHIISTIRHRFWPICARRLAQNVIKRCLSCQKRRAIIKVPRMADLPVCRMDITSGAFSRTGVDYFGPLMVKVRRSTIKRWGCLFTCMSTRAVHLELADSLETDDFIMVLRRFIARRGHPRHIYSDNGTNFTGADRELRKCLQQLNSKKLNSNLAPQGIEWHFNPPASPHFGGAWERLVRSTKRALKAVLQNQHVCESVLRTTLVEVEAILNSRPLTHNSTDPEDLSPLTPNHFLIGRSSNAQPPDTFEEKEINSQRRWRRVQVLADQINRRFLKEYLPGLTVRNKWREDNKQPSINDLIMVLDEKLPRGNWELGRVLEVMPGDDGRIRTVKVKTANGVYCRPAARICILEEHIE